MAKPFDKKFGWVIKDFSSLQSAKCYSVPVLISDCKWRLVAFPKGNTSDYFSLYLDVYDAESLPCGWRRLVNLRLSIVNQLSKKLSIMKETEHCFDGKSTTWGFPSMFPLSKLHDKDGGFLVNEEVMIVAELDVFEVIGTLDESAISEEASELLSNKNENVGAESTDLLKKASPVKGLVVLPCSHSSVIMGMGGQVEKSFTWKLKSFSTLQDECYYSPPFEFAGLNWHIFAYPKYKGHLSLYVGLVSPESLPSEWRNEVLFCLTVVNNIWINDTKILCGQTWFDASTHSWGFREFLPSSKLGSRDDGFLVGDSLIIVADLHVFPLIAEPLETVRIIEPLSNKLGIHAANASLTRSQGDSSCQLMQRTENDASQENVDYDVSIKNPCGNTSQVVLDDDDASEEGSDDDDDGSSEEGSDDDDDDDDASEEGSDDDDDGSSEEGSDDDDDDDASEEGSDDDDDSSPVSNDGGLEKKPLFKIGMSHRNKIPNQAGAQGDSSCQVVQRSENEASQENVDYDVSEKNPCVDTSQESSDDDDASQEVADDDNPSQEVSTDDDDVDGASEKGSDDDDASEEETMDVNGFQVFSSQVESVSHIFKRHPDIALSFRPKNLQIRRALMNELLSLIEMLCQSPEKLSEDDMRNADETLTDLIDVGFKLDWLKIKLNEVSKKKKKDQISRARLRTMEAQLQKLKLMLLDLDSQLRKEKAEVLAARAPLSFNDVVC